MLFAFPSHCRFNFFYLFLESSVQLAKIEEIVEKVFVLEGNPRESMSSAFI